MSEVDQVEVPLVYTCVFCDETEDDVVVHRCRQCGVKYRVCEDCRKEYDLLCRVCAD